MRFLSKVLLALCVLTGAASFAQAATAGGEHAVPEPPVVNWTDLGYSDKDVQGGTLESGEEPMAPPMLFAILNFAIFAGLMYWKAGPALSKYLANRHESIKNALEEAAKLQAQAKEKMAEYSARIADADAEVTALIAQIRKDAEIEREQIVADAKLQAERLKRDAEARIESEFATARRQLENEVIAKASEVAEKLLRDNAGASDHNNLFNGFIAGIKDEASAKGGRA